MAVTLTTEPIYVLPGRKCQVTCATTIGNFVRVSLTAAPEASTWTKRLRDEDRSEIQLWAADEGEKHEFTFDVAGAYSLTLREYTKGGVTFGGDYAEDPSGYQSETAIGETTTTINVAQKMTAPLRFGAEQATLTLYVHNAGVIETTVPEHGERTPRLDSSSPRLATAVRSSAVEAALVALGGVAVTTAAPSLGTVADNFVTTWNAHCADTDIHVAADTDNIINTDYAGATTADALRETVQHISSKVRAHYTNDAGTGVATGNYHSRGDWNHLPLISGVGDVLSASLALVSLWHSFEQHRQDTDIHADTGTNALNTLAPLYSVYQKVVDIMQTDTPTAPTVDNPGATLLVHRAGLTKA